MIDFITLWINFAGGWLCTYFQGHTQRQTLSRYTCISVLTICIASISILLINRPLKTLTYFPLSQRTTEGNLVRMRCPDIVICIASIWAYQGWTLENFMRWMPLTYFSRSLLLIRENLIISGSIKRSVDTKSSNWLETWLWEMSLPMYVNLPFIIILLFSQALESFLIVIRVCRSANILLATPFITTLLGCNLVSYYSAIPKQTY